MNLAKLGATALKIYTCHLLVFTGGVICGSVMTFGIVKATLSGMGLL